MLTWFSDKSPTHYGIVTFFLMMLILNTYQGVSGEEPVSPSLPTENNPLPNPPKKLLDTPIFKENEQVTVLVHTLFDDRSTNIAFYIKCPNVACPDNGTADFPVYIFSAENISVGTKAFSDYWAPPVLTDYIAIEYKNDAQQYTCSDKTVEACIADSRFVSKFEFALVSNTTNISPEMIAAKNIHLALGSQGNSLASDALINLSITLTDTAITSDLQNGQVVTAVLDGKPSNLGGTVSRNDETALLVSLSIAMSTPSITSNLEDGKMVTAVLDGKSSPTAEPQIVESSQSHSVIGSIVRDIVDTVIDIFTGDTPEPTESTAVPHSPPTPATLESENAPAITITPEDTTGAPFIDEVTPTYDPPIPTP